MKIFGRWFVFPVSIYKSNTVYGDTPNLSIRWGVRRMSGTMKTTSYTLEVCTKLNKYQWVICWRPDVTRHWWKESK